MKKIISFAAMAATMLAFLAGCDQEDAQLVDLTKSANAPSPFKNFKADGSVRVFAEMPFKIADSSANGGKAVLTTSAKKPVVEIDTSAFLQRSGKYVFLLHSYDAKNSFGGEMTVFYRDGRKRTFYIKETRDIGKTNAPAEATDNALPAYMDNPADKTGVLYLTRFDAGGASDSPIERISFKSSNNWIIAGISVSSAEVQTTEHFVFDSAVWKPIDTADLSIRKGSALDLSSQMTPAPCGTDGYVVIGKTGNFEFEKKPGISARFKGTNLRLANRFPTVVEVTDPSAPKVTGDLVRTHEDIDAYVNIMKKQGYNAVRWRPSMRGKAEYSEPYKYYPETQDMYDYYVYALKREGVYMFYYLCSNDDGAEGFKWDDRGTIKIKMMLGDETVRNNWRKLAKMQLEHVNKYTGVALKDDPVVATLEFWNEFEIGAESYHNVTQEGRDLLNKKFAEFLQKNYGTVENFLAKRKDWVQPKPMKSFADVDIDPWQNRNSLDYAHFIIQSMEDTQKFWRKVVFEEIGMRKLPTHQNNCNKRIYWGYIATEGGGYQAINTYHTHPSSYLIGGIVPNDSEMDTDSYFWRCTLNRNVVGMPTVVTEYQHCHFNQYKHEAGIIFPAYSALNNYDALMVFEASVAPKGGELGFFNVAENPVYRANDFINFFLFYRGDVKTSPNRVDVVYDKDAIENSQKLLDGSAIHTKIGLMTGFALDFPSATKVPELKDVKVAPASLTLSALDKFDLSAFTEELKSKGILPKDNISDPAKRIFQSDTGEITMRSLEKLVKVVTPKSEAITLLSSAKNEKLANLTVKSADMDAAIAVSSLDNKPIGESSKLVLTIATDAIMNGFGVSKNRLYVTAWGEMPVLIETGKVSLEIKLATGKKFSVYSLKLNGERIDKIPAEISTDGAIKLDIDTSKYTAVFFEIVAE